MTALKVSHIVQNNVSSQVIVTDLKTGKVQGQGYKYYGIVTVFGVVVVVVVVTAEVQLIKIPPPPLEV